MEIVLNMSVSIGNAGNLDLYVKKANNRKVNVGSFMRIAPKLNGLKFKSLQKKIRLPKAQIF